MDREVGCLGLTIDGSGYWLMVCDNKFEFERCEALAQMSLGFSVSRLGLGTYLHGLRIRADHHVVTDTVTKAWSRGYGLGHEDMIAVTRVWWRRHGSREVVSSRGNGDVGMVMVTWSR
jgi:hypothetical protein